MPEPTRKPTDAESRAAMPAATQAAHAAQTAADAAVDAAEDVGAGATRAAERVQDAADQLTDSLKDTADDLKSTRGTRLCPNCKGELVKHGDENQYKAGSYHCNTCGVCWAPGIREPREGHPMPKAAEPFEAR